MPSPKAQSSRFFHRQDIFYFLFFLMIFLMMFRDFYFTRATFYERDTALLEIPARRLCSQLLKEGNFALWTDDYGQGQPFLANPKNAVLYPTTSLYLILPFFTAFKLHYLIHVLITWLGLYYLCRVLSLSRRGSFLGASLFIFCGMYLSSFEFYNHIAALAWMPWILLLTLSRPKKFIPRLCLLSVLWGLMILAGTPEILLMTGVFLLFLLIFRGEDRRRQTALIVLSLGLAGLISAAQILPSVDVLSHSERPNRPSSLWPLEMVQLPNLVFPNLLGNDREPGHNDFWGWHIFDKRFPLYYSLYWGFGALILSFLGLGKPWDYRQKFLLASLLVFFLVANGRYSPFFALLSHVPLMSLVRYPIKYLLGSMFSLSLLAALGHDKFFRGEHPTKRSFGILSLSSILAISLFWLFHGKILNFLSLLFVIDQNASLRELDSSLKTGILAWTLVIAFLVLSSTSRIRRKLFSWAVLALVLIDPVFHNRFINPVVPVSFFDRAQRVAVLKTPVRIYREEIYPEMLKERTADNVKFLGYLRESLYPFAGLGEGFRYCLNLDFYGFASREEKNVWRKLWDLSEEDLLKVLKALGCQYRIGDELRFSKEGILVNHKVNPYFIEKIAEKDIGPYAVFRNIPTSSSEERLRAFLHPAFDPAATAITGENITLAVSTDIQGGEIAVHDEIQGRGHYTARLPSEAILVFPGNFRSGWKAWINGQKANIFPVNLFSKGVVVPAGTHEIQLRYFPESFQWGVGVSLAAIGAMIGLLAASIIPRPRKRPPQPD